MTRVFLAAGVAALAIAAPASADPHGGHGGGGGHGPAMQARGGGGGGGGGHFQMQARGGGGGGGHFQMQARGGGGGGGHFAMRGGGGFAMQRPQRAPRMQMRQQGFGRMAARQQVRTNGRGARAQMAGRQQFRMNGRAARAQMAGRQQMRMNGRHAQAQMAARQQMRMNGRHAQAQMATRQQMRMNGRHAQAQMAGRQQLRMNGRQANAQMAARQQMRANGRMAQAQMAQQQQLRGNGRQFQLANRQQLQANGAFNGRMAGIARQQQMQALRSADPQVFRSSSIQMLDPRTQIVGPARAAGFIGQPLSTVTNYVPLAALPASVSYLYPDTPAYYYQYGGGYLYQVDRGTSLIDALIPLLAGGFLPGTYLPQAYMSSYVPDYYGLNAFYPASYGPGYGYGYDNLCNRYAYGVVYQVDCMTGMVVNVVPMYAGGYGVGQMLPSAYSYYNVPMQYRSLYYPTADYSYWYAPGAIYQYNPSTSLITSVAALMSPGFTVGQPLPAGYGMYNVPMAYRATYYDTPNAWYRYNNGYIYQVDPATMLVTSVVASLLS